MENSIFKILSSKQNEILDVWIEKQLSELQNREDVDPAELRQNAVEFINAFTKAISTGNFRDISAPEYKESIKVLERIAQKRVERGFSPTETVTFVFNLKNSVVPILIDVLRDAPLKLSEEIVKINKIIEKLSFITIEEYMNKQEKILKEQMQSIMELSSPIISIWDNVLTVPVIGILDSERTQLMMENLLTRIVETASKAVIIDVKGVAVVDTAVANHLIKTVKAIGLLGAEAFITGIRPEVAQTLVGLGIDLKDINFKGILADALSETFEKLGYKITKE
jgi:rsbT co-antagonist protein RsbR